MQMMKPYEARHAAHPPTAARGPGCPGAPAGAAASVQSRCPLPAPAALPGQGAGCRWLAGRACSLLIWGCVAWAPCLLAGTQSKVSHQSHEDAATGACRARRRLGR